ncbi:hypothetical protein ALT_2425 [Aspergillus lentulus]|uniref:Uncharacterized protein n=1 Tax=Aspergillus lentulus TaxID=293939 RepID=A0AAN4T8S2_ASPLE|nr:hypothetical protein ALT_2425 [Aspergillus lentulus]
MAHYQNKVRQGQNRIEDIGGSQSDTLDTIDQTPAVSQTLGASHGPGSLILVSIYTAEETTTRPIIPGSYQIDAVLLGSSPFEPESTSLSSHHADYRLPPPVHLLEPLYELLQRYDFGILLSRAGARIFLARRVAVPSDEENQRFTGPEANIIELDEHDHLE